MTSTVFPLVQIPQIPLPAPASASVWISRSPEMRSIVLATLAFSVVSTSAAAAGSFAASTINGLLALAHEPQSIYARQSLDPSTLPAACKSACTPIYTTLNDCTTAACTCTITNGDELEGCINCLVSLSPTTSQIQLGQEVLNNYDDLCSGSGIAVPSLSLSYSASPSASVVTATNTRSIITATDVGLSTVASSSRTITAAATTSSIADSSNTNDASLGPQGVSSSSSVPTGIFGNGAMSIEVSRTGVVCGGLFAGVAVFFGVL